MSATGWDWLLGALTGLGAGATLASLIQLIRLARHGGPNRRLGWFAGWVVPWWRTEVLRTCPNCQRSLRREAGYSCWMCIEAKR